MELFLKKITKDINIRTLIIFVMYMLYIACATRASGFFMLSVYYGLRGNREHLEPRYSLKVKKTQNMLLTRGARMHLNTR
jgi:hypothetical protein